MIYFPDKTRSALMITFIALLSSSVLAQAELTPDMLKKTDTIAVALEGIAPEGWVAAGPVERYTVENMYDKINGRSELYMSYDVVGMTFVTLYPADAEDKTTYVDIFLYDMAHAENAYGVYGVERWPGNTEVKLGRDAYRTETDLFLWHGQYYATLLSSGDDPRVHAAATAMAEKLVERLEDRPEDQLWGMAAMPEKSRLPETLQFFKVDAMSLDFMTNTYTADYDFGGEELRFFLSHLDSEADADKVYARYQEMLQKYGENYAEDLENKPSVISADLGGGYYDLAFKHGHYVGGITAAQDLALAKKALDELFAECKPYMDKDKKKSGAEN